MACLKSKSEKPNKKRTLEVTVEQDLFKTKAFLKHSLAKPCLFFKTFHCIVFLISYQFQIYKKLT